MYLEHISGIFFIINIHFSDIINLNIINSLNLHKKQLQNVGTKWYDFRYEMV